MQHTIRAVFWLTYQCVTAVGKKHDTTDEHNWLSDDDT